MSHSLTKGNIIGKRLQKIRKEAEIGQVELAAMMCVDKNIKMERTTISQIERGLRAVKDKEILAFCKLLKITPNQLFGYDDI